MRVRRALTVACVIAAALLVSACGSRTVSHATGISGAGTSAADANNNGNYVTAGPVSYQLEVSRELNQYSPEDSGYLMGLPKKAASLTPNQLWFGVFMWAKNNSKQPQRTTNDFDLVDTQGNVYRPLSLNTSANPYAWKSITLAPGYTEPNGATTAGVGPTGGRLLLFKLNYSIYDNRPLTLQIRGNTNKVWATISLDL